MHNRLCCQKLQPNKIDITLQKLVRNRQAKVQPQEQPQQQPVQQRPQPDPKAEDWKDKNTGLVRIKL